MRGNQRRLATLCIGLLGALLLSSLSFADEEKHIHGNTFKEDSKIVIQEERAPPEYDHLKTGDEALIQTTGLILPRGWLAFVQQNINEQEPNYAR